MADKSNEKEDKGKDIISEWKREVPPQIQQPSLDKLGSKGQGQSKGHQDKGQADQNKHGNLPGKGHH
jgi:hypothetical protein